jgi:D-alanine transaminase
MPIAEATVSVEDRGFLFGDGVYELVAVYNGRPFLFDRHLARLQRSAAAIRIEFDFAANDIRSIVREGLRRSEIGEAMVYIQITRGAAPRSHVFPVGIAPTLVLTFRHLSRPSDAMRRNGARVMTTLDTRWTNCYIKAITLLPNVLARNEALQRGYDEAVFVTRDGEVRECTSANLFMVRAGEVLIPPLTESILHGVTLGFIVECAERLGVRVREEPFHIDALRRADEVFLSSTTAEVLAITAIDDRPVGDGKIGATTKRLFDEFRRASRAG